MNFRHFCNQEKIAKRESVRFKSRAEKKERRAMTTTTHRDSATIYEFPLGGRASRSAARSLKPTEAPKRAEVEYGSGWYHDAAVEEEYAAMLARTIRLIPDRV